MTTSCSASNLGTLTRIPSTEYHAGPSTVAGTLTRTVSVEQYTSIGATITRVPSAEQYATSANLNRVPSTDQQPYSPSTGTFIRIPSEEKYACGALNRVSSGEQYRILPSSEQYPTGTLCRVPSMEQYPSTRVVINESSHHGNLGRVPSVESSRNDLQRIPSEQNGHRLSSEYHSLNTLRDPNAR